MDPKVKLRQEFRSLRQQLDIADLSQRIRHHLRVEPIVANARILFAYLALPDEIDLEPLMAVLPDKTWGIPRCLPGHQLSWHRYNPATLTVNPWRIREPAATDPLLDLLLAEIILVPALACDPWGRRLGYGGGFYDRILSPVNARTIGIVPSDCLSPDPLPEDPWDVRLDAVVTEQGIRWVGIRSVL